MNLKWGLKNANAVNSAQVHQQRNLLLTSFLINVLTGCSLWLKMCVDNVCCLYSYSCGVYDLLVAIVTYMLLY